MACCAGSGLDCLLGESYLTPLALLIQVLRKRTQVQVPPLQGDRDVQDVSISLGPRPQKQTGAVKGSQTGFLGTLGSHPLPSAHVTLPSFPGRAPLPAPSP